MSVVYYLEKLPKCKIAIVPLNLFFFCSLFQQYFTPWFSEEHGSVYWNDVVRSALLPCCQRSCTCTPLPFDHWIYLTMIVIISHAIWIIFHDCSWWAPVVIWAILITRQFAWITVVSRCTIAWFWVIQMTWWFRYCGKLLWTAAQVILQDID